MKGYLAAQAPSGDAYPEEAFGKRHAQYVDLAGIGDEHGDDGIIARGDAPRPPEGSIAVAQVHHHTTLTVWPTVCRYQVRNAVAIEVTDRHEPKTAPHPYRQRRLKGPIAVSEQHREDACSRTGETCRNVGDREIQLAIAIEVSSGHGLRKGATAGRGHRRLEGPIAVAEQHRDGFG